MMVFSISLLALISFALMFIAMWSRATMMTGRQHDVKHIRQ